MKPCGPSHRGGGISGQTLSWTRQGTATLASGAASYSTSALAVGPHSITVSYSGDSIFGAVTSAASTVTISVAPAISFAAAPSSLTVVHGSSGTVVITGTPVGGYTGTVTFGCGTLPTGASCTFAPSSLVFSGNNTAASTTLTFNTVTTTASLESLPGSKTLFQCWQHSFCCHLASGISGNC